MALRRVPPLVVLFCLICSTSRCLAADEASTNKPRDLIVVFPFQPYGADPADRWIGGAVRSSLIADLSRVVNLAPTAAEAAPINAEAAAGAGKQLQARYVVLGGYQTVSTQLRITGELIDVQSGVLMAGLKATGTIADLFELEDTLIAQLGRAFRTRDAAATPHESVTPKPSLSIEPSGPLRLSYLPQQSAGATQFAASPTANERFTSAYDRYRFDTTLLYGWGCYGYGLGCYGWGWGYRCGPFLSRSTGYPGNLYGVSIASRTINSGPVLARGQGAWQPRGTAQVFASTGRN